MVMSERITYSAISSESYTVAIRVAYLAASIDASEPSTPTRILENTSSLFSCIADYIIPRLKGSATIATYLISDELMIGNSSLLGELCSLIQWLPSVVLHLPKKPALNRINCVRTRY